MYLMLDETWHERLQIPKLCLTSGSPGDSQLLKPLTSTTLCNLITLHFKNNVVAASYGGSPGSHPGHSMWDLWWTEWHWDRVSSEFFGVSSVTVVLHTHVSSGA
jgi:hypothetical protein